MARIYKNISTQDTHDLIVKKENVSGDISKITIANHDDTDTNVVQLHLFDGASTTYVIAEASIPPRATLVLDDNLSYDGGKYSLRLTTSSTADTTVIIK